MTPQEQVKYAKKENPFRALFNWYVHIYYRMYLWNFGMWGENDGPRYNVAIWLSLVFLVNVLNVNQIIQILFAQRPLDVFGPTKLVPLALFAIGLVIHYLLFVRGPAFQRAKIIATSYCSNRSTFFRLLPLTYNVGSILTFFGLLWIRKTLGLIP